MLATTPSGTWLMRSRMPLSSNTVSSAIAFSVCARKKSMRGSRPLSSLRDWLIGLPTSCVSVVAKRVELGDDRRAKALDRRQALAQRRRRPGRLRRARGGGLGGDRRGVVGRTFVDELAGGRVVDLERGHRAALSKGAVLASARAASRKSCSSGASLKLSGSPGMWNSGCHCTAATYDGPLRRTASIMPSSGQHASTTKPGARSLIAWWWIELTVACRTPG